MAEGRIRLWIAHMALVGAIGNARERHGGVPITVKGGVAMELRLRTRARATRELDLTVHGSVGELGDALAPALANGYGAFTFRRTAELYLMPNGAVRLRVAVQFHGQAWTTIQVDLSESEVGDVGSEAADGLPLEDFGLAGPASVPCLPLPYQIAQKLHAVVGPTAEEDEGEGLRHMIDLLLLRDLVVDWGSVRVACERLFAAREHPAWPPMVPVPTRWERALSLAADEVGLAVRDLAEARRAVERLVERITTA